MAVSKEEFVGWSPRRAGEGGENSLSRVPTGQGFIFLPREGVAAVLMRPMGPWAGVVRTACGKAPQRTRRRHEAMNARGVGVSGQCWEGRSATDRN